MKNTEKQKEKTVCLVSSSGGHFEELMMLTPLSENFNTFVLTEKTKYNHGDSRIDYFTAQINRKQKLFALSFISVFFKSLFVYIKEKPDVVISTGVLAAIPMMLIGHFFKKKVIYIESFAKINSPTKTGAFIYKKGIADRFYVQWESMKEFYPDALYLGGMF